MQRNSLRLLRPFAMARAFEAAQALLAGRWLRRLSLLLFLLVCLVPRAHAQGAMVPPIVTATDGLYPDKVVITVTVPPQPPCGSTPWLMLRNVGRWTVQPPDTVYMADSSGGTFTWTDTRVTPGVLNTYEATVWHCYAQDSAEVSAQAIGSDTGYAGATPPPGPYPATDVSATRGTVPSAIRVSFTAPDQTGRCPAGPVQYSVMIYENPAVTFDAPLTGGSFTWDDTTYTGQSYQIKSSCSTGVAFSAGARGWRMPPPPPPYAFTASDGWYTNSVSMSVSYPALPGYENCTLNISRNGWSTGGIPIGTTGGTFDSIIDANNAPSIPTVYTAGITCSGVNSATVWDRGYRQAAPAIPVVSGSQGTFPDRNRITITESDQTGICESLVFNVYRASSWIGQVLMPATGGTGTLDDMNSGPGKFNYTVYASCAPSNGQSSNLTTAFRTPTAPTSVAASDGTFTDRVAISVVTPTLQPGASIGFNSCTINVSRPGWSATTAAPSAGGTTTISDPTAPTSPTTYTAVMICDGATSAGTSDTGFIGQLPQAPSAVTASDGTFPSKVNVSFTAPDQTGICGSASYVVTRNGTDVGTITTIPLTGGTGSFDDTTVPAGVLTYGVRAVCGPGNTTSNSTTDTGYKAGSPAAATSVAATDGLPGKVTVTWTGPNQSAECTAVSYKVKRDGSVIGQISTVPLTGGAGSFDDTTVPLGVFTYTIDSICSTPGSAVATSAGDTGYRLTTPAAVSGVAASDGAMQDRVRVTWTAPDQSLACTSVSYVVTRDGSDLSTLALPLTGGAGTYDDTTVSVGVHTYGVRAVCSPGNTTALAATDTGFKAGVPLPASAVSASDGLFISKVSLLFTVPIQSASCTSVSYVVTRDGIDAGTVTGYSAAESWNIPYDDTAASAGPHTYAVRSVCFPGGTSVTSTASDTGFKQGTPTAVSSVAATDGTYANKITVSFVAPNQSLACSAVSYDVLRDGSVAVTTSTVPLTGGSASVDDTTAGPGTHSYTVRATCTPGGATATAGPDSGYWQGTPSAPTAVAATDGTFADRVRVTFTAPNQGTQCTGINYFVSRDGSDVGTATVAVAGGPGSFDDLAAPPGVHTYAVRAVCAPGTGSAVSAASDTGFRAAVPAAATAVTASDGTFPNKVTITFTAPNQTANCTSTSYVVTRDGSDLTTISTIPNTGGPGSFDDTTAAAGTHTYGVRSVCTPGNVFASSASDTGYWLACTTPVLAGPQGTGAIPSTLTWSTDSAATQWVLNEGTSATGPFTAIATLPPGTTSQTVPGWPHKFYRLDCVAANPLASASSAVFEAWGDPAPVVTAQTFPVGSPGSATITPVITDPDGNTTFTITVTSPPANGTVAVSGSKFVYTPNAGFAGTDTFTIKATDPGGQSGTGTMTADVTLLPPGTPSNVVATNGTLVNQVAITWGASINTLGYRVFKGTTATDPAPIQIADVGAATLSYTESPAAAGVQAYYSVQAYNGPQLGTRSAADLGYADTPITALSAAGTTDPGTALDLALSYTDPDPGDVPTLTILTQPANGTVAIIGGKIRYAPNGAVVGTDTFTIRATDRAGQSTTGTATVTLNCIAPSLGSLAAGPTRIFVNGPLNVTGSYNTGTCPQAFTSSYRLLQGTTVVDTASLPSVPAGSGQSVRFSRPAPVTAGNYTAELTITNTATNATVVKTVNLVVSDFRPPVVNWDKPSAIQDLDSLTLTVGTAPDCTITTDPAAAQADPTLCLVETASLPTGVAVGPQGPTTWKWTGLPSTPGTFSTTVAFSAFDASATKRVIATISKPMEILALSSISFTSPASVSVKQNLDLFTVGVNQAGGPACPLVADLPTAVNQVAAGGRACVLDWATPLPPDTYLSAGTLKGSVFDLTRRTVSWTVSAVDAGGVKHQTSTGSTDIVPVATNLDFDLTLSPTAPYAQITPVTIAPKSIGSDTCGVTSMESQAMSNGTRRCLFEFGAVTGLSQPSSLTDPQLRGTLPDSPITTVPYTVSVFVNGVKHQILSGSKDLPSQPPLPPSISFEHVREIAPDTYAVSVLGGAFGVLATSTAQGQVDGTSLVAGDAAPTTFSLNGTKTKRVLYATAGSLYSARTVDVSVALSALPSFSSRKQITVVTVPRDGLRLRLDSPPKVITDTSVLTVSASVVQPTANGLVYVPGDAGPWVVAFGEMTSNGVFSPLTPEIPIDPATGQATSNVPIGTNTVLRLTARARAVSSYAGYTATLTSPTQVISIVKGTPISGSLAAVSATTGPAPMLGVMKVVFDTLGDHAANVSVVWSRSEDNGLTWTPITTATGLQYAERMAAGVHLYKVQFTNRNTQETSESAPLQMEAYDVPSLTIEGPGYLLPNNSANYVAKALNPDGSPMTGAIYEWSLALAATPTAPVATGSGGDIAYTASDLGVYRLTVRSRAPGTSATDPSAWKQTIKQIVVASPTRPVARISGPLRVEVGKPATFTANVATTFSLASTNLTLGGQWTLPDGTTVPGATLTWTPTPADLAASNRPIVTYTAWIVGYEGQTTYSTTSQLTLWQYVWPNWKLAAAQGGSIAPANAQFTAIPDNAMLVGTLEGLTYTWTVPGQLRVIGTPTSKLTGIVDYGGTYTAQVVVSDARGNSTSLSADVTMIDAPPMVVDLVAQNLSKWSHAPILLGVTTKATGGHPLDAVTSWTYTLDGAPQALPNQSTARFSLDSPGTYNVRVDISTKMGATANKTVVVNVPPNTAPNCAPTGVVATNRRSIALKANCTDADGLISRYTWAINGVPVTLSVGAAWTAYLPADQAWPVTVDVNATDDGGATSTGSVTFN